MKLILSDPRVEVLNAWRAQFLKRPEVEIRAEPVLETEAGAVLLPAFAEESAFRGFIQSRLERFGPALAIAGTAVLFALFHHDAYGMPTYLVMGAYLGYATWKFGSIWPAAAAHATNNALALLQANGYPEAWWWERVAVLLPAAVLLAAIGVWRLVRTA
jgi:membrane protease YdiL (CAAX protease family)